MHGYLSGENSVPSVIFMQGSTDVTAKRVSLRVKTMGYCRNKQCHGDCEGKCKVWTSKTERGW